MNKNFSWGEAVLLGISFYLTLAWTRTIPTIPLFNFPQELWISSLLPIFTIAQVFLFIKKDRNIYWLLGISFASIFLIEISRYSASYAFRYITLLVILFVGLFKKAEAPLQSKGSQLFLGLLFLYSALQKINPQYLSGQEFVLGGDFIVYFQLWLPGLLPTELPNFLKFLPHLSVVLELVLAGVVLYYPRLSSHLIAAFLLTLSFINPPVLFVYLLLLPLLIYLNPEFEKFILRGKTLRRFLTSPFLWALTLQLSLPTFGPRNYTDLVYLFFPLAFLYLHGRSFAFERFVLLEKSFCGTGLRFLNRRVWLIPGIMTVLFGASFYFLPSPYGFKMFAAKRFSVPIPELRITSASACDFAETKWKLSPVTDTYFKKTSKESCILGFPTSGGLLYAGKKLCLTDPHVRLVLKNSHADPQDIACSTLD